MIHYKICYISDQHLPWLKSSFFFYQGMVKTMKKGFYKRKINLKSIGATLSTPQKASGSVLKTMWSFDSKRHILNQLPIVA